jgi:hypothetical protein
MNQHAGTSPMQDLSICNSQSTDHQNMLYGGSVAAHKGAAGELLLHTRLHGQKYTFSQDYSSNDGYQLRIEYLSGFFCQ